MANLIDISTWEEKPWYSTGGTRDKCLVESPEGDLYYFKTSLKKEKIDYKYEFWSEIVASGLGSILDLKVLEYTPAIKNNLIGCLCKSMVKGQERLTEGMNYLVGFDNKYDGNAKDKEQKSQYSYQLIVDALKSFRLEKFIPNIDELIVFDALIGNGDRHQENWAVISEYTDMSKAVDDIFEDSQGLIKRGAKKFLKFLTTPKIEQADARLLITQTIWDKNVRFAPIYDSGSSLGREHNDDKLQQMMRDKMQFEGYLNRGRAEIHWQGEKLNHFHLLNKILENSEQARKTINNFEQHYNQERLNKFIYSLGEDLPSEFKEYQLTECRKEFLTKLIALRYQRILNL